MLKCKHLAFVGILRKNDENNRLSHILFKDKTWPRSYIDFFMLNSSEHELYHAQNCLHANNCGHLNIYQHD